MYNFNCRKVYSSLCSLLVLTLLITKLSYGENMLESFEIAIAAGDVMVPLSLALIAGFLTALSPCVYPLIPITLSIMGAQKYESHAQGFLVASSYVLGMSLIYSVLGAIFASIGMLLGSFMQHPVILLSIAIFLALMAFSMLGAFNVVVPAKLLRVAIKIGGNGFRGAFMMGLVAGLLAAPCTGPVLGFILTLIAEQKNVVFGSVLMLSFSFGLGAPFLVLGTFSSAIANMPKSGAWMERIKYFFGAAILASAVYYLSLVYMPVQKLLSIVKTANFVWQIAISIVALTLLFVPLTFLFRLGQFSARLLGAALAAVMVASMFSFEMTNTTSSKLVSKELDWRIIDKQTKDQSIFDQLLKEARQKNQPVLIDFYADWCIACKQLESITFKDPNVYAHLKRHLLIRIDATSSTDYLVSLQNRFKVTGLPTIVFIDKNGDISPRRVLGFMPPEQFLPYITAN